MQVGDPLFSFLSQAKVAKHPGRTNSQHRVEFGMALTKVAGDLV